MVNYDRKKVILTKRLEELERRLHGIEETLEETPPKDFEDFAAEQEETEVLEHLGTAGQHEIAMIRAALNRIEKGTYGHCQSCGEMIDEERLSVLPETPICKSCAKAAA